jgi:hypothetical protein
MNLLISHNRRHEAKHETVGFVVRFEQFGGEDTRVKRADQMTNSLSVSAISFLRIGFHSRLLEKSGQHEGQHHVQTQACTKRSTIDGTRRI